MTDLGKSLGKLNKLQIFLILLFFGLLVYSNAIFHPFIHDDVVFIEKNIKISSIDIKEILFSPAPFGGKSQIANSYYRPLLDVLYRIQYIFFNKDAYKYHLFNIILHIVNAYLLFLVLGCLFDEKQYALSGALLFLIHPVQSEAVACIVGVSNILYLSLCVLSFYLYLLSKKESRRYQGLVYYLFSLMIFALSLLVKEQSVVLPIIILLYEFCLWIYGNKDEKHHISRVIIACKLAGFFFLLLGYFYLRKIAVGTSLIGSFLIDRELGLRILSVPRAIVLYVGLIFFPVGLHYYRNIDILQPFLMPTLVLSAMIVSCVLLIHALRSNKQKFLAVFGLGFFCVSLMPVLNIVPIVNEYSLVLAADHFMYLPIAGMIIFILVLAGQWRLKKPKYKTSVNIALLIIVVILGSTTFRLNSFWASDVSVFQRTVKYESNFGRGHQLLAKAYYFNGKYGLAVSEYNKALAIMQGYVSKVKNDHSKKIYLDFVKEIYFDLGYCYQSMTDLTRALSYFKKVSELDPDDGGIHNNIGIVYVDLNDMEQAVEHFETALHLNSADIMAKKNLAIGYMRLGRVEEAEKLFIAIEQNNSN